MSILRGLNRNGVGNAIGRAQPVGRRGLGAPGQRRLDARRRIDSREADDAGEVAIEVDLERRVPERFLDTRIGDAWDMPDFGQQFVGEGAAGGEIVAGDLDVDRRGRAEIEDLADDVGRRNENVVPGNALGSFSRNVFT